MDQTTTQLAELRRDIPAMSAQAHFQGYQRLQTEMSGLTTRRPTPGWRSRRALAGAGLVMALTAGAIGYQVAGPSGADSSAQAATVLRLAAAAVPPALHPRADQFIYTKQIETSYNNSTPGHETSEIWVSADGSKPGLARDHGSIDNSNLPIGTGRSTDPLSGPYNVMAKLPTDPATLLAAVRADPEVIAAAQQPGGDADGSAWVELKGIIDGSPSPVQAAAFEAAALIPGITYSDHVTDAAGRTGVAVSLNDPHLGSQVQFIFNPVTHGYLGWRLLEHNGTVLLSFANISTAVVDKPGQLPS